MKKIYVCLNLFAAPLLLQSQSLDVDIEIGNAVCGTGGCTTLTANFPVINQTDTYAVSAIPFNPPFPTTGGTQLDAGNDDVWTQAIDLPFDFSFFGTVYSQILVGSNGVVSFDLVNQNAGGFCQWSFSQSIPNIAFPIRNAIYGAYQDTDITSSALLLDTEPDTVQNVNYYPLDGIAPNRIFVVNFNQLPQFQCNGASGLQTTQIVLYEGSNNIDVYVHNRTPCNTWNAGRGVIGVQNAAGTQAVVPPGRNTGNWSATNEAWRFSPGGAPVASTLTWAVNGVLLGNNNPMDFCVNMPTTVTVEVQYGSGVPLTGEVMLAPYIFAIANPEDITICTTETAPFFADLTVNEPLVLANVVQPENFEVSYYTSEQNAIDGLFSIQNPSAYLFDLDMTIYMRIEEIAESGCTFVRSFALTVNPTPDAPTGAVIQNFNQGQTLADVAVTGQNIQWYDAPQGGNLLPADTMLENNITYYASQTVADCESRMSPGRLAVTVVVTLGNAQFGTNDLKLYPNPVTGSLYVQCSRAVNRLRIYNLIGQPLMQLQNQGAYFGLVMGDLASGTYLVKIETDEGTLVSKFIKK